MEDKISIPSIQFYGAMLKCWTEIIKAHIYFLTWLSNTNIFNV